MESHSRSSARTSAICCLPIRLSMGNIIPCDRPTATALRLRQGGTSRRTVGGLVLPGQRSIHMKNEHPRRRRHIAEAIVSLPQVGVSAVVIDAGRGREPEHARGARALRAIVERPSNVPPRGCLTSTAPCSPGTAASSPGAGPEVASGALESGRSSRTSRRSEMRKTRAPRPSGRVSGSLSDADRARQIQYVACCRQSEANDCATPPG